ncbi:MAG: NfeD family protein [Pseudomonadota bacterium]
MGVLFGFLDGASPWWWVALALTLGAFELMTFSYFLLWLALAALATGGALWLGPEMSGMLQVALFAFLSMALTAIGYVFVKRRAPEEVETGLNNRTAALIGRKAVVAGPFEADTGPVEVDGIRWRGRLASGPTPEIGDVLEITGADGMLLHLSRVA